MTILHKLQCLNCSATLSNTEVYRQTISCKYCGSSYQINLAGGTENQQELIPKIVFKALKPSYLEINKTATSIEFVKRWRKKSSFILLGMSLIWISVISNELIKKWLDGADSSIVFLFVFIAIGLLLLFRALSEIFNKSTLQINKKTVSLKTKPFVWKGDFSRLVEKIKYFEILPPPGPSIPVSVKSYRICAITDDDMRLTLVHGLKQPGHAIYIFREINKITKKQ